MTFRRLACLVALTSLLMGCGEIDRLRLKARLGGLDSQIELARRYASGDGVTRDDAEVHLRIASKAGTPHWGGDLPWSM